MNNLHLGSRSYQSTSADQRLCVDYFCFISTDTRGDMIFRRGAHGGNKRKGRKIRAVYSEPLSD